MAKFFKKNRRALFYGFVIALGVVFLQQIAATSSLSVFMVGAVVLGLIFVLELYTNYFLAVKLLKQLQLPNVSIYTPTTQTIYHAFLPILLFISILGFVYSNNIPSLSWLYFSFSFFMFTLLFINIRAYYEDKFKLEESTHLIYDLIKIFIFFAFCNTLLNLSTIFDFNFYVRAGIVFAVASLLTFLVLLRRKHYSHYNILLIIFAGLAIGYITSSLLEIVGGKSLLVTFYSTLIFYLFNAVLHHEIERNLTLSLIFEYVLVAAICLLVIVMLP